MSLKIPYWSFPSKYKSYASGQLLTHHVNFVGVTYGFFPRYITLTFYFCAEHDFLQVTPFLIVTASADTVKEEAVNKITPNIAIVIDLGLLKNCDIFHLLLVFLD